MDIAIAATNIAATAFDTFLLIIFPPLFSFWQTVSLFADFIIARCIRSGYAGKCVSYSETKSLYTGMLFLWYTETFFCWYTMCSLRLKFSIKKDG
jgi:hypothetical protein